MEKFKKLALSTAIAAGLIAGNQELNQSTNKQVEKLQDSFKKHETSEAKLNSTMKESSDSLEVFNANQTVNKVADAENKLSKMTDLLDSMQK